MLAKLAAPERKFPPRSERISEADWLEDDVAVLSYESALKSRARRWGVDPIADEAPSGTDDVFVIGEASARRARPAPVHVPGSLPNSSRLSITEADVPVVVRESGELKRIRITIRMSEAEFAQIRDRAAEAGMAVSAYLRTCTAEIETLRAQVKETLARLRPAHITDAGAPVPRSGSGWLKRLWPQARTRQQSA